MVLHVNIVLFHFIYRLYINIHVIKGLHINTVVLHLHLHIYNYINDCFNVKFTLKGLHIWLVASRPHSKGTIASQEARALLPGDNARLSHCIQIQTINTLNQSLPANNTPLRRATPGDDSSRGGGRRGGVISLAGRPSVVLSYRSDSVPPRRRQPGGGW